VSIITYKSLFARFARSLAKDDSNTKSKRLKFETPGAPTIYLAHVFEDWDMASPAADALAACGVDTHVDWCCGRMFTEFDEKAELMLSTRLGLPWSWLVVLVSERTPPGGRIQWVLELERETLPPARFALLPVHYGTDDWPLPEDLAGYPRIEEMGDDLCVTGSAPGASLPLCAWLRYVPPA
jgi:hypothetical protein